jgi:ubiquinone/menaquinone biosynthesis C-methylase UbiE
VGSNHVCPWWMGYLLASPLRRLGQDPHAILAPHVRQGMSVLEPGPGMGFFTLELARLVGPTGKVMALDVQPKMLDVLARRARKAGLSERIVLRKPRGESMDLEDLSGQIDFALVFALVHELPDRDRFFREVRSTLKAGGRVLLAEPKGHVDMEAWRATLEAARRAGFSEQEGLAIRRSHASLLAPV